MKKNQNFEEKYGLTDFIVPSVIQYFIEKLIPKIRINYDTVLIHNIYNNLELPLPINVKKYYFYNATMIYSGGNLKEDDEPDTNIAQIESKPDYEWTTYDSDDSASLNGFPEEIDLILALPPWNKRTEKPGEFILNNKLEISYPLPIYDSGYQEFLSSLSRLKQDGIGVFVFPVNLFYSINGKKALKFLNEFGYYIDGIFELPKSSFYPYTSINANVIIVKRGKGDKVFVGSLTNSESQLEILIDNYITRRDGKTISLGKNFDLTEFTSVTQLIENEEIIRSYEGYPYPLVKLSEIAEEIFLITEAIKESSAERINSLFLPKIGTSRAVNRIEEVEVKVQNIFQLVLKKDKVESNYLASFFNTELGYKIRKNLNSGSFIPTISKSNLEKAIIPLPPIEIQRKLFSLTLEINNSKRHLEQIETNLWQNPKNLDVITKNYNKTAVKDSSNNWIENLPFPLASILKGFFSTTDIHRRFDFILYFFEALSEFLVIIKLSGLSSDKNFYKQIKSEIFSNDEKFSDWYKRADFGGWNTSSYKLTKAIKKLLNDLEKKEMVLQIFDSPSNDFINLIIDKKVINILVEVARYRNNWKGHGGIADDNEFINRINKLMTLLNEVRESLLAGFRDFRLITPISMEKDEGIYIIRIKELKGSNTTFQESYLKAGTALENKSMYFTFKEYGIPVKIIPLVKIGPSPKTSINACYFYNRIDKDGGFRYISYHFDKDADIIEMDKHINEALALFQKSD